MKFQLEGLDETKRAITAGLMDASRAALAEALPAAGEVVAAAIRAAAPKRTGRMAADFGVHVEQSSGSTAIVVRPDRRGYYALFVDGGTRFVAARPFVEAAAASVTPQVVALVQRAMQASLERWSKTGGGQ